MRMGRGRGLDDGCVASGGAGVRGDHDRGWLL